MARQTERRTEREWMGRGSNVKQHRERTKLKPARIKQRQKIKGNEGPKDLPEKDLKRVGTN